MEVQTYEVRRLSPSPCPPRPERDGRKIRVAENPIPIRVLIVDDHAAVRRGLNTFLAAFDDLRLVGEAASGAEALELCAAVQPDIVLMDLVMPGMSGALTICAIHERWPHIGVIALTSFQEADLMQEALQAGAICCLLKNVSADELSDAIRAVYQRPPAPPNGNGNGNGNGSDPCRHLREALEHDLRPREREVLNMLVKGMGYPEIAEKLTVNSLTAKFHVSNVLYKLGVKTRSEAIALALENHLVG